MVPEAPPAPFGEHLTEYQKQGGLLALLSGRVCFFALSLAVTAEVPGPVHSAVLWNRVLNTRSPVLAPPAGTHCAESAVCALALESKVRSSQEDWGFP